MTNDTPSAPRINAPQPIDISEAGTVERAIQIEERMEEIEREIIRLSETWEIASAIDRSTHSIDEKIEELESEFYDLQREYRG